MYLLIFMEGLIKNPLKQESIGQAIVTAARPSSSLSPILFGTAVEMDHMFGSKWLLGELSSHGFSKTFDEVTKYKQSVVCNDDPNDFIKHATIVCRDASANRQRITWIIMSEHLMARELYI